MPQELWRAGKLELAHGVTQALAQMRAASAVLGVFLAEIEARGAHDLYGYASTARWLEDTARISRGEAQNLVKRALVLNPTRGLDGTEISAFAPATAAAVAEGAIGDSQVDRIVGILRKIPGQVSPEVRADAEQRLVALAREAGSGSVTNLGDRLLAYLDPDGSEPKDPEPPEPRRELTLQRRKDGFWKLSALLDDELGTRTAAAIDAYAQKRPVDEFGQVDLRSPAERRGDALADLIDLAVACPDQPGTCGYRTMLHVTLDFDALKTGVGTACLDYVGEITAREARLAACDCLMLPVVLSAAGEPLDVGRLRRFVTPAQRRALNLRDRGCSFPGCRRTPKHTHAHHISHWADGGPTDLCNLCLLCAFHHRLIHFGDWQVSMATDGHPEFIPPQYLDPLQAPRRNTFHRALT